MVEGSATVSSSMKFDALGLSETASCLGWTATRRRLQPLGSIFGVSDATQASIKAVSKADDGMRNTRPSIATPAIE